MKRDLRIMSRPPADTPESLAWRRDYEGYRVACDDLAQSLAVFLAEPRMTPARRLYEVQTYRGSYGVRFVIYSAGLGYYEGGVCWAARKCHGAMYDTASEALDVIAELNARVSA